MTLQVAQWNNRPPARGVIVFLQVWHTWNLLISATPVTFPTMVRVDGGSILARSAADICNE